MSSKPNRQIDVPPYDLSEKNEIVRTEILATVTIIDVFDISEPDNLFEIYFFLKLKWKDFYLKYAFLKNENDVNFLSPNRTWTPNVQFFQIRNYFDFGSNFFVEKNSSFKPFLSGGLSSLNVRELYNGKEHFLNLVIKKRAQFICKFSNIKNYPFGKQKCTMGFYVEGNANNLTMVIPKDLIGEQGMYIGEYLLENWDYMNYTEKYTGEKGVIVTMVLTRNILSIFMVTYLPTILMNIINQATNHINGDSKYDLIITVNITSMMVLASIYLSVSTSLPKTPNIKPVEIWLLANLIYPFLVIICNIFLQVHSNVKYI